MVENYPSIDCVMMTYGRHPILLEESIESFLRQDYAGKKRLIILNDFADQTFQYNHPEVSIINLKDRIRSLGVKHNEIVWKGDGDIVMTWDDDDISLPWRMTTIVEQMDGDWNYYNPSQILEVGAVAEIKKSVSLSGSAMSRRAYEAVGGAPDTVIAESGLASRIATQGRMVRDPLPYAKTYYIYNKKLTNDVGSSHISSTLDVKTEREAFADKEVAVQEASRMGIIPSGVIALKPHWERDYVKYMRDAIAKHKEAKNALAMAF